MILFYYQHFHASKKIYIFVQTSEILNNSYLEIIQIKYILIISFQII